MTDMTELRVKYDLIEYELDQNRYKHKEELRKVDARRKEINSKYHEIEYRLNKQIELHGDFDLINKENKALNDINTSLEKQVAMLTKDLVIERAKYEASQEEVKKVQDQVKKVS